MYLQLSVLGKQRTVLCLGADVFSDHRLLVDCVGDLHNVSRRCGFVSEAHLLGESGVRNPIPRSPWCRLFQHPVHLFERKTLGLRDKEIGKGEGDAAEGTPQEEDFRAQVRITRTIVYQVWSNDTDNLVK